MTKTVAVEACSELEFVKIFIALCLCIIQDGFFLKFNVSVKN